MEKFQLTVTPSALYPGECQKCKQTSYKMYDVILSSGAKSQKLFLCENCTQAAKDTVDKKNLELMAGQKQFGSEAKIVSDADVRKLRELTGAGMNDCRNALKQAKGNMDTAAAMLRQKPRTTYPASAAAPVQPVYRPSTAAPVQPAAKPQSGSQTPGKTFSEALAFWRDVVQYDEKTLENSIYLNLILFLGDIAKTYSSLPEKELAFAMLGILDFEERKGQYAAYSQKYNNNLQDMADHMATALLCSLKQGQQNNPDLLCLAVVAALFCSHSNKSVCGYFLKKTEEAGRPGQYVNEGCKNLWAVLTIQWERFGFRYNEHTQNAVREFQMIYGAADTLNRNTCPPVNTRSTNAFQQGENTAVTNSTVTTAPVSAAKQIVLLGRAGHGKSTLLAAIKNTLAARESGQNSVSFEKYATAYTVTECPDGIAALQSYFDNPKAHPDCAVLVISSVEGPMAETKEQLNLLYRLGVNRLTVFMSMADCADDPELLEMVEMEIRDTLAEYGFDANSTIISGSALQALQAGTGSQAAQSVIRLTEAIC